MYKKYNVFKIQYAIMVDYIWICIVKQKEKCVTSRKKYFSLTTYQYWLDLLKPQNQANRVFMQYKGDM
jgi:hypothetical protein